MVFTVVIYGCESGTIKKAECRRIDAFELWCWRRLLTVPWTARRSNHSILKEFLKLKLQYFGHLMWRIDSLEETLMLGKIEGRRRRDELVGWHHWLYGHEFEQAPGVGWRTGKPGVLQSVEVTNSWTQLNDWTELPSVWWALPQVTTWPTPSPPAGQKSHLFKYEKWKWSHSVMSDSATLWMVPARHLHPWDFPGKITGVGCYFLLQGVFPTQESNLGLLHCRQTLPSEPQGKLLGIFPIQGSNPGLLHCRWILYQLSHTWGLPDHHTETGPPSLFYFCHQPLTYFIVCLSVLPRGMLISTMANSQQLYKEIDWTLERWRIQIWCADLVWENKYRVSIKNFILIEC